MRRVLPVALMAILLGGCSLLKTAATSPVPQPQIVRLEPIRVQPRAKIPAGTTFAVTRQAPTKLPPNFMRFAVVNNTFANEVQLSDRQFRMEIRRIERQLSGSSSMVVID